MSDYEKVMEHLKNRCEEIKGKWNGDESGQQEEDSLAAEELLELLQEVDKLVKELDL